MSIAEVYELPTGRVLFSDEQGQRALSDLAPRSAARESERVEQRSLHRNVPSFTEQRSRRFIRVLLSRRHDGGDRPTVASGQCIDGNDHS